MSLKVEFKKSGKIVEWDDNLDGILDLAEENGITIEFECRQGYCGTCKTKLLSGEVHLEVDDGLDDDDKKQNMFLPCVAIPKTDVVIEA